MFFQQLANDESWGFYNLNVQIDTCHEYCASCTGPDNTDCPTCNSLYFKLAPTSCLLACPVNGYFTSGKTCIACHTSCLSCNGGSNTNCLTCPAGTYYQSFSGIKCLTACETGNKITEI